ncbi:hypothetical protein ES703_108473 [subsurface metagenome]
MKYEEMRAMEQTHVCAVCEGSLVTVWDPDLSIHALVCGKDRSHQGYQRIPSVSQLVARGQGYKLGGPHTQESLEDLAKRGVGKVSLMVVDDLATNKPLEAPQLTSLITWGVNLGLKPWLGHVCIYFGKPYISIDGYYYKNNERERPFAISTRPMNDQERKDYKLGEDDHGYIAEGRDRDGVVVANGTGIATKDEIEGKSKRDPEQFRAPVVHGHPQRMAEKRAEWQLLRKLIPLEEQE